MGQHETRQHETRRAFQHARFGELRELLQGEPSPERWDALCRMLSAWHGAEFDDLCAYVEARLSGWPDDLREPPTRWRRALNMGKAPPHVRLVRRLNFHLKHDDQADARRQRKRLGCAALDRLTIVEVSGQTNAADVADALHRLLVRQARPLARLGLTHNPFSPALDADGQRWQALCDAVQTRTLTMDKLLDAPSLDVLAQDAPLTRHLERLEVHLTDHDLSVPQAAALLALTHALPERTITITLAVGWWRIEHHETAALLAQLPPHVRLINARNHNAPEALRQRIEQA